MHCETFLLQALKSLIHVQSKCLDDKEMCQTLPQSTCFTHATVLEIQKRRTQWLGTIVTRDGPVSLMYWMSDKCHCIYYTTVSIVCLFVRFCLHLCSDLGFISDQWGSHSVCVYTCLPCDDLCTCWLHGSTICSDSGLGDQAYSVKQWY